MANSGNLPTKVVYWNRVTKWWRKGSKVVRDWVFYFRWGFAIRGLTNEDLLSGDSQGTKADRYKVGLVKCYSVNIHKVESILEDVEEEAKQLIIFEELPIG
jgi:hypothetical protein